MSNPLDDALTPFVHKHLAEYVNIAGYLTALVDPMHKRHTAAMGTLAFLSQNYVHTEAATHEFGPYAGLRFAIVAAFRELDPLGARDIRDGDVAEIESRYAVHLRNGVFTGIGLPWIRDLRVSGVGCMHLAWRRRCGGGGGDARDGTDEERGDRLSASNDRTGTLPHSAGAPAE